MNSDLKSNIWKYYLFNFLSGFSVSLPFFVYYFQELGFDLVKISIMGAVFATSVFIFEIPSGYFADKVGRKKTLFLSTFFWVISLALLYSTTSFLSLSLSHFFLGLGMAFASGTDSAFIYDSLLSMKREKDYKKIEGKSKFILEMSIVSSSLIGVFVVQTGIRNTILFTLIGQVILLYVVLLMVEPPRHKLIEKQKISQEIKQLFKIVKESIYNKKLLGIFVYSFIILGFMQTTFKFYQPYFRDTGLSLPLFGAVSAFYSIFAAITALYVHNIEEKLGVYFSLLLIPIFLAISFILGSVFFVWYGFMFFILRELVRGFVFPVLSNYTNQLTTSDRRATVMSIGGMFSRIGYIIISILFALFAEKSSLQNAFFYSGMILLVLTILFVFLLKFKKN